MRESRVKSLIKMAPLALVTLALVTLALLAVPALALAGGPAHMHGDHLTMLTKKLNLTEEQQASAKQMFADLKAKMAPVHAAQKALHTQLKAALGIPEPDAATVGQVVIQMHQNRAQLKPVMAAFHQQFEALLTPEQLATYKTMQARHAQFRQHWGGGSNPSQ